MVHRWGLSSWTCTVTWSLCMMWNPWRRSLTLTWTSTCGMRLTSDASSLRGSNPQTLNLHPCWHTSGARVSVFVCVCVCVCTCAQCTLFVVIVKPFNRKVLYRLSSLLLLFCRCSFSFLLFFFFILLLLFFLFLLFPPPPPLLFLFLFLLLLPLLLLFWPVPYMCMCDRHQQAAGSVGHSR